MDRRHLIAKPIAYKNLSSYESRNRFAGPRIPGCALVALAAIAQMSCTGSTDTTTPPAHTISVSIAPIGPSVFLGATQPFTATVSGATNTAVTWEVAGIPNGNSAMGQISSSGIYTAPAILPASPTVNLTAISAADASATSSTAVTIKDDIVVTVAPQAISMPASGQQVFSATISASGSPAQGVAWSVNGIPGGNSTLGTVSPGPNNSAVYFAPATPPTPASITIAATSVADSSKSDSSMVTISCTAARSISPPSASLALGATQSFTASFCLAAGASIAWDVNGIPGGSVTLGTLAITGANSALYSAPADLPISNPITIHVTASAITSGTNSASAAITIAGSVSVAVSPPSATVPVGTRSSFAASVTGTPDVAVSWFFNSVSNGSASVGQICIAGSNPCAPPAGPTVAIDYLAPSIAPNPSSVTLKAVSRADSSQFGSATIIIVAQSGPVAVTVAPLYAFLPPSSSQPDTQQFHVSVANSTNSAVIWSVQSAAAGQGCAGATCGTISATGFYTAPNAAPSPNAITVTATSQADNSQFASANVVISSGPTIESIAPSSVMAGAVQGFPLAVHGVNFIAGGSGSGSTILINGSPRNTACSTADLCALAINPQDLAAAATLVIEVQNPGSPGGISNPVPFVIVPFDISTGIIALSAAAPTAASQDIVVTDPTTAASSSRINIQSIGLLTSANSCVIQGSPLSIARPASGTRTTSICVFGNALDPTFTYALSGPADAPNGSDIGIAASAVTGLLPGMIELNLQISSVTQPGVRTLFVTTLNGDRAVATGLLEIK